MPVSNCIHQIAMVIRTSSFCPFWDPESSTPTLVSACCCWLWPLFCCWLQYPKIRKGLFCVHPAVVSSRQHSDQRTSQINLTPRKHHIWDCEHAAPQITTFSANFFVTVKAPRSKSFFLFSQFRSPDVIFVCSSFFVLLFRKEWRAIFRCCNWSCMNCCNLWRAAPVKPARPFPPQHFCSRAHARTTTTKLSTLFLDLFGCHFHLLEIV